jgi:hypothetical protein
MNIGLLNQANPIVGIDPRTGRSFFRSGRSFEDLANFSGTTDGAYWGDLYKEFQQAQSDFPGLSQNEFFDQKGRGRSRTTSYDRDGDGVPDRTTRTRTGKNGGQINPLVAYLLGGFSFDPRDY